MKAREQAAIMIMASIIVASGFVSLSLRNRYLELDQRYDELSTEYTGLLAHYDLLYSTHQEMIDQNIDYKKQIIELRQDLDKLKKYEGTWRSYRDQYEDVLLENARLLGLLMEQEYDENISIPFVESRKEVYRIGDTITFEVEAEMPLYGSYFTIRDPDDKLVFEGDPLGEWIEVDDYWAAAIYCQTAYHDPMVLTENHPLGNWTWSFTFGDIIHLSGWFEVIEALD